MYKEKMILWACYVIAIAYCITLKVENDKLRVKVKELEEKAMPTIRKYNNFECNCFKQ